MQGRRLDWTGLTEGQLGGDRLRLARVADADAVLGDGAEHVLVALRQLGRLRLQLLPGRYLPDLQHKDIAEWANALFSRVFMCL